MKCRLLRHWRATNRKSFFVDRNVATPSDLSVTENSPNAESDEGGNTFDKSDLLASDALGAMETSPNDKASEASESCSDSTRPTSLAMSEAPPDDQLSEQWEQRRDEHDVADKEAADAAEEDEEEEQAEEEHDCGEEPRALGEEGLQPQSDLAVPEEEPTVSLDTGLGANLTKPEHQEENEESRAASRAKLLSGPWDEVLDDEDDNQVNERAEHSYSPWERLLTKHLPAPERIEEGNEEEEEEAEEEAADEQAEIEWSPHWNQAGATYAKDQQASHWSQGWGAEGAYESQNDGWMAPFDDLIQGSCFNAHSLSQPMPLAHAAGVFGENAVFLWSTTSPAGGVDGPSSADSDDVPKEVFTNGQQVFKPVPSADGQTLFTDGAQVYASVCVLMGPPSTDVAKSDGQR